MSIRPVEFNGIIQRTDDIGTIKQQEDNKPLVDQQNIQTQVEQKEDAAQHQVISKDDSPQAENQADAREEGKGVYYTPTAKKKKHAEEKKPADRVIKKSSGGFDIKI
jgi:hypothetical protein